jgi:hypothetical protein
MVIDGFWIDNGIYWTLLLFVTSLQSSLIDEAGLCALKILVYK